MVVLAFVTREPFFRRPFRKLECRDLNLNDIGGQMAGQGRRGNPVYQFCRLTGFCRLFRRYDNHLPEGGCFGKPVLQACLPAGGN